MLLHEENVRPLRMHCDVMHAMADLRIRIGNVLRMQPAIDRFPALPAIVGPERACRRDRDENSLRIFRIEENTVEAHSARARLPARPALVSAHCRQLRPLLSAV